MRFGIHVPNFGDFHDLRAIAELARVAEDAGWDGFFLWDHILFRKTGDLHLNDPWITLAAIAMSTESIRLGPLVTPLPRRRPWKLAREAVTLDHLSGGRLILGVGLGAPTGSDFRALGEETDDRVRARMLDEGLDVLAGLWSGRPFTYKGDHYRLDKVAFHPTPVQTPRIPIWVAGYWPNKPPFRRAARWDGVFPIRKGGAMRPKTLREIVEFTKSHRTPDGPFDVVLGGGTPGDDPAKAAKIVRPVAEAGLTWWLEGMHGWRGPFEEMRERVRQGPPRLE